MKPNWFIGFSVPVWRDFSLLFKEAPNGIRIFHPNDLHLTVAFFGGSGEVAANNSWTFLSDNIINQQKITLGNLQGFGNEKIPSVYSYTLDQGREALITFMLSYQSPLLKLAGAPPEKRYPKPHITIGRIPKDTGQEERHSIESWAKQLPSPEEEIILSEIALFTWHDNRPAQQFKKVKTRELEP